MTKYEQLFTSVPTKQTELAEVKRDLYNGICDNPNNIHVPVDVIKKCILRLKSGKSDRGSGFDSNHLIHGSERLFCLTSILFNCMITHGHTAEDLLYSTIVSIPKNMQLHIT